MKETKELVKDVNTDGILIVVVGIILIFCGVTSFLPYIIGLFLGTMFGYGVHKAARAVEAEEDTE